MGGRRRWTAADGPRREPPVATAGWLPGLPADLAAAAPGRMVVCCRRPGRPAHDSQRDWPGRAFVAAPVHLPAARRHRGERVTGPVTVDIAGAQMGGAARYAAELRGYLARTAVLPDEHAAAQRVRLEPGRADLHKQLQLLRSGWRTRDAAAQRPALP